MLIGKISPGSGVGDQLFCYLAARVRAADLGVDFGFVGKEYWKAPFINVDWGKPVDLKYHIEYPAGKLIIDDPHSLYEIKTPYFDPEYDFIPDNTVIDGYMAQDEKYWRHRFPEISRWLEVEPIEIPDDVCVINFRGGEFKVFPELFLPKEYWYKAIEIMGDKKYEVHTDDPETAREFFPNFPIIHNVERNWKSVRFAKNIILANSAFGIIPALLSRADKIIAPRYWSRRNIKQWITPMNYYHRFKYI